MIQPTAHLVNGTVPGLHGHTHFWQDAYTHTHTHAHMLTPEGMSYLKLTSQHEHIHAGIYKPGHTLGHVGRRHSVQRVRHEWHSGHRLPLAHSGCILHTGSHTHTQRLATLISLQLSPAAHSICLGLERTVFKWLYSSPQALNNRTWTLRSYVTL